MGVGQFQSIRDPYNFDEKARVVNGRLLVSSTGGGGGGGGDVNLIEIGGVAVGAGNPLYVAPGTGAAFPVTDNGGSLTVDGTVDVGNFPASQTVDDGGGSLTVDGTVAVSNFPASQTVSGTVTSNQGTSPWVVGDGGGSLTVDGSVSVSNFPASQTVDDGGGSLTVDGEVRVQGASATTVDVITDATLSQAGFVQAGEAQEPLDPDNDAVVYAVNAPASMRLNRYGEVYTDTHVRGGNGRYLHVKNPSDGVDEDFRGVVAMVNVSDDPSTSDAPPVEDRWNSLYIDTDGYLFTKGKGDVVTTDILSGSTNGRPILVSASASPGTTLHTGTSTAGEVDKLYMWASNKSASPVTLKIQWGGTASSDEDWIFIPPEDKTIICDGALIKGGLIVRAYATSANQIEITGRRERLSS